jgi:hypothetical protein
VLLQKFAFQRILKTNEIKVCVKKTLCAMARTANLYRGNPPKLANRSTNSASQVIVYA